METITFDLVIRSANVAALIAVAATILKVAIPVGLSIRDSLRDTAIELRAIRVTTEDHERRLRVLEHEDRRLGKGRS